MVHYWLGWLYRIPFPSIQIDKNPQLNCMKNCKCSSDTFVCYSLAWSGPFRNTFIIPFTQLEVIQIMLCRDACLKNITKPLGKAQERPIALKKCSLTFIWRHPALLNEQVLNPQYRSRSKVLKLEDTHASAASLCKCRCWTSIPRSWSWTRTCGWHWHWWCWCNWLCWLCRTTVTWAR